MATTTANKGLLAFVIILAVLLALAVYAIIACRKSIWPFPKKMTEKYTYHEDRPRYRYNYQRNA